MPTCGLTTASTVSPASCGFDTVFNSHELISADQVEVIISRSHQRISAPSIDAKAIDATWEQLTQQAVGHLSHGAVDGKLNASASTLGNTTDRSVIRTQPDSSPQRSGSGHAPSRRGPRTPSKTSLLHKRRGHDPRGLLTMEDATVAERSESSSFSDIDASDSQTGPMLYNALKFRLHDVEVSEGGAVDFTLAHVTAVPGLSHSGSSPLHVQPSGDKHLPEPSGDPKSRRQSSRPARVRVKSVDFSLSGGRLEVAKREDDRLDDGNALATPLPHQKETVVFPAGPETVSGAPSVGSQQAASRPGSTQSPMLSPNSIADPAFLRELQWGGNGTSTTATAASRPKTVMLCKLKLGITDYKTSVGTSLHVRRYTKYVAGRNKDVDVLFGPATSPRPTDWDCGESAESGSPRFPMPPARVSSARSNSEINEGGGAAVARTPPRPARDTSAALSRNLSMTLRGEERVGRADFIIHRTERYLANALGVEAMVITADNFAVLFRRSAFVAEYPGFYCCPGGHPEPSHILNVEAFTGTHAKGSAGAADQLKDNMMLQLAACKWFKYVTSDVIVQELFSSVTDEVSAELGVPLGQCRNRGLMSIIRNAMTRKPDMCFLVTLECTATEVAFIFNKGTTREAFESQQGSLVLIDLSVVRTPAHVTRYVSDEFKNLITPASYAALLHGVQCLPLRN